MLQHLRSMLLFHYLVSVFEGDFMPRNIVYEGKSVSIFFVRIDFSGSLNSLLLYCRNNQLGASSGVLAQHASGICSSF